MVSAGDVELRSPVNHMITHLVMVLMPEKAKITPERPRKAAADISLTQSNRFTVGGK